MSAATPAAPGVVERASSWMLGSASEQGLVLSEVAWVLVVGATLVFLITMVLLAMSLRRRKRSVPVAWWVIGGGMVFPVVVLSGLLVYSTARTAGLDQPPTANPLVISVTGRLWWWDVRYRDPSSGQPIALANELRVPLGRPVQLGLSSEDVIHSFWVPALGGKMDTVPGRVNRLVFTATQAGTYRGVCAEYCGAQHARMALQVVVMPQADFDQWLQAQARPAAQAHGRPAESVSANPWLGRGRQAFADQGCVACHTVRGHHEPAAATVPGATPPLGPDLTHVASRLTLGAGVLRNEAGAMAHWLTQVQTLKPGARMPSMDHLDPDTLQALSAYLESLQ